MRAIKEERTPVTIRFPKELIARAKALKNGSASFNDLVVKALEAEVRRHTWKDLLKATDEEREQTLREQGVLSDSRQLIRELREGLGRSD